MTDSIVKTVEIFLSYSDQKLEELSLKNKKLQLNEKKEGEKEK
ncbi:recombinase [Streptococcus sp. X16XC17]|nr:MULTISPECIES: SP_0009 family protein [unclassified Streptococcus]TCD45490.1 recombinase [Streptococcus sp. X16XC17]